MDRVMWRAKLLPGMKDEYIKRHDEIWLEMTKLLNEAGVHNYSIFCHNDELFGYYEATLGADHASSIQAASPIVAKWALHMDGLMEMLKDEATGRPLRLEQVFYHE